jgi:hypothetical protein
VAFQLDPTSDHFNTLYKFPGGRDSCDPETQMRPGSKAGTLFGSTVLGGSQRAGTLFLLSEKGGKWTETVLYTFTGGDDGSLPQDITEPADDAGSSIYGVAQWGGSHSAGVVFRLSNSGRKWVYKVIYTFTGGNDGGFPVGLCLDQTTGSLYGTTMRGGTGQVGVVFALGNVGGSWSESVVYNFAGGNDGANPQSRPLLDPQTGVLYGTTLNGGTNSGGTIYSVKP